MAQLLFFNFSDFFKTKEKLNEKSIIFQCLGETYECEEYEIEEKFINYIEKFIEDNDFKIFCITEDMTSITLEAKQQFLENNFPELDIKLIQTPFLSERSKLITHISEFYNSHGNKKNSYIIESNPIVIADLELIGFKSIPIYEILELENTKNKEV